MIETSPAVRLRSNVVLSIVITLEALTVFLYASLVVMAAKHITIPGELWLAAGTVSGGLLTLLVNTKHDSPADVNVVNPADQPVPVEPTEGD